MFNASFRTKIRGVLFNKVKALTINRPIYFQLYISYWHSKFYNKNCESKKHINYLSSIPNRGAGIGHQMTNWISGYALAGKFGLKFGHIPFSSVKWDEFLSFGIDEILVENLVKVHQYKKVSLPLFDEYNQSHLLIIESIIRSYSNKHAVFITEQDQIYHNQHQLQEVIKKKFHSSPIRSKDNIIYSNHFFNIAIHIRRGDISIGQKNKNPNLLLRWQDNQYYVRVLKNVLAVLNVKKPVRIYLFSQGEEKDFEEFTDFKDICFCLGMNAQNSFLHMVYSDLLITSKSSFSYKPALLNNGLKICPESFWIDYPKTKDFILVDDNGSFSESISIITA